MQIELLKGGWVKQGSVIAFPYEWQRPAKTEEWVYETLIEKKVNSMFVEFIAFPWATLIDLIERGKFDRAKTFVSALNDLPPKKTLIRASACQHISIDKIKDFLFKIKITDFFWAHKIESKNELGVIRLHPMALFPVAYFESEIKNVKPNKERKYLYNFVGAYDLKGYISPIRNEILNLPESNRAYILKRKEWHFESTVYKSQINGLVLERSEIENSKLSMNQYREIMQDSVFTLCPSGAGPNSIRLWEALAFESYPIILSDDLDLPLNVLKNGFQKTKEKCLNDVIAQMESSGLKRTGYFFAVEEFISNISKDLFSKEFILQGDFK